MSIARWRKARSLHVALNAAKAACLLVAFVPPGAQAVAAAQDSRTFLEQVDALIPGLAAPSALEREAPQRAFERLCHRAARPGAEPERAALCAAIVQRLGGETSQPARVWMLRQLETIGGEECVEVLALLLADADPQVREHARRALQHNRSRAACAALCAAARDAREPAWKAALIAATGACADPENVDCLRPAALTAIARPQTANPAPETRAAPHTRAVADDGAAAHRGAAPEAGAPPIAGEAPDTAPRDSAADLLPQAASVATLGAVGGPIAAEALTAAFRAGPAATRHAAAAALLRIAERERAAAPTRAARIAREIYAADVAAPQRAAALRTWTLAAPHAAAAELLRVIEGGNGRLGMLAAQFAVEAAAANPQITSALLEKLPALRPRAQALLLHGLAQRGEPAVRPAAMRLLAAGEAPVRLAALQALEAVGDASCVTALARAAAHSSGPERAAARRALARLADLGVDAQIVRIVRDAQAGDPGDRDPGERIELIAALAARHARATAGDLMALRNDADETVRAAALDALGQLAGPERLPDLVDWLLAEADTAARESAIGAVARIAAATIDGKVPARVESPPAVEMDPASPSASTGAEPIAPVIAALATADTAQKTALVAVLGRVQGAAALAAIRAELVDADEAVADAVIRALSGWKDAAPLADLLRLARAARIERQRVLALRGYAGLVRLPSDRSAAESLRLLEPALPLASAAPEQRLLLSALGDVADPRALRLARMHLTTAGARDEAALAVASIARRIAGPHAGVARAALNEAMALDLAAPARQAAKEAAAFVDEFAGYIDGWRVSPAYDASAGGEQSADVFDAALPPERGELTAWQPHDGRLGGNPFMIDLGGLRPNRHAAAYARARVWSPAAQPARLELGSDDGVKAWLNGELVHSHRARRAVAPRQDLVVVDLREGWNELLLKVVNLEGGWAFCCGLRSPQGRPLAGLRFAAE